MHYLLNKLFIEDYCVWIQKVGSGGTLCLQMGPVEVLLAAHHVGASHGRVVVLDDVSG